MNSGQFVGDDISLHCRLRRVAYDYGIKINQTEMKRISVSDLSHSCGRTEAASASRMFVVLPVQINKCVF